MADPIEPGDEVAIKPAQRKDFEQIYGPLPDALLVEMIDDSRPRKCLILKGRENSSLVLAYASDCIRVRTRAQREAGKKQKVQKTCQFCGGIGLTEYSSCPDCKGTGKVWVAEG